MSVQVFPRSLRLKFEQYNRMGKTNGILGGFFNLVTDLI